jgi:Glycine rich protein
VATVGKDAQGRTTYTFTLINAPETWTVPPGVSLIKIEAWGGEGGKNIHDGESWNGGKGGYAYGNLSVTPGESLTVVVGGKGGDNTYGSSKWAGGGYNGGGDVTKRTGDYDGAGCGGGASDVRRGGTGLADRIIVAGGGGGAGGGVTTAGHGGEGGAGGGLTGQNGQTAGGAGGAGGTQSTGNALGIGGNGLGGTRKAGGAGGGGYWGGLAGASHDRAGGGGGGSSYYGGVTNGGTQTGVRTGDGQVVITILVSNQPPTLTLTSPSNNQTLSEGQAIYTGNNDFTIRLTADDADPLDTLEYQIKLNGVIKRDWTPIARNTPVDYTFLKADYTKDRNSFTVTVRDSQGGQTVFNGYLDKVQGLPVNIVSSAYLVSRMSPPVRLSNGWLVGAVFDNTNWKVLLYKSTDAGRTWVQIGYRDTTSNNSKFSIVSKGTNVYVIYSIGNTTIGYLMCDALTATGEKIPGIGSVDVSQTGIDNVSLAITPDGTKLWWAASTKNSSYPNSFNIRAGSVPINADGTLGTPSAVTQVTTDNTTAYSHTNPSLSFLGNNPSIVWKYSYNDGTGNVYNRIHHSRWDGTKWLGSGRGLILYEGNAYPQSSPMAIRTQNGKLHVVWHGTDPTDATNDYVRYSNSTDGVTWLSTPKKLVKGQNASITSDKNGKLFITYEDGGYIKRIESTDEFATWSSLVIIEQGSNPVSLYDPTFSTPFSVPPTIYQTSSAVRYYGILNQQPTVTLTTADGQVLTEGATLQVEGSAMDYDVDNNVLVKYRINSGPTRNLASGVSDGIAPILFARALTYRNKRIWDGVTDVIGVDLVEDAEHILRVWAEDDQGGKSAEVIRKFRVVWNRPPEISGENGDLGILEMAPVVTYSVSDPEGNAFTVVEKINGVELRSYPGEPGREERFEIPLDTWLRLEPGVLHTISLEATDSDGGKSTRTYTFTRFEDEISFEIEVPWTTDAAAKRILLTLDMSFPPGAILLAEATNNAFDESPVWEDISFNARYGRGYVFHNDQKTADKWGVSVRVRIEKGTATDPIEIKGFGGAFD